MNRRLEAIIQKPPDIQKSPTTMSNSFDILLKNEGYTLGKFLECMLYDLFYHQERTLTFVTFLKKHPHDTDSLIRIALADGKGGETNGEARVIHMINIACRKGIEILQEIASDFQ